MADQMPWEQTYESPKTGDPESFKKTYYDAAVRAGNELKVDPNIILGQWGEETGWGKSIIPGTNNLGNIKGKGVQATDNQTKSKDTYRSYKSVDDFADDYVKTVKTNFPSAVGAGNDKKKFTSALSGYAEDKKYAGKVQAASDVVGKVPNPVKAPWEQQYETPAAPQATSKPTQTQTSDKDYQSGSSDKATFGEAVRDVGQGALATASGLVGGMAGLATEIGATAIPAINEPKPYGLGIDPYKAKQAVENALQYEPKTAGGKAVADVLSTPGKIIGAPQEALVNAVPDKYKATADIASSLVMPQVPRAAGELTRKTLVGGDAARTQARQNVTDFRRAGVPQYSLGQVSEGGLTQEAGASKRLIQEQEKQVAAKAEQTADKLSQTKSPEEAGKTIREAIGGTPETKGISPRKGAAPQVIETGKKIGGYLDNQKQLEEALYDKMYKVVGKDTQFAYPNLFKTLDDLTTQNPNLPATSGKFINKGILDLKERLVDDTGKPKTLGYEDARWLRNKIGQLTDPRQIVPGDTNTVNISPAQADALYAAMSEDMMAGVQAKGPRAELATLKANQFSRQMHQEISNHLQPVMNSKTNADLFNNATSGTTDGAERVRTTMKTLDPLQKDAVQSVFFRELGRKGDQWDMGTFASNYGKMHADAKDAMFGGKGKAKLRGDLDAMAKTTEKLNVDENTWHKLKSFLLTQGKLGTMAATGVVAGAISHSALPIFLAGPALGFITGTMVRNPKFVDWFLKASSKTKPSSIPLLLSNLQAREKDMSPDDRQETEDYINKVNGELNAP